MGILKVGVGALKSVLEDSWREYFYCPAMEPDVLVKKGENSRAGKGDVKAVKRCGRKGRILYSAFWSSSVRTISD